MSYLTDKYQKYVSFNNSLEVDIFPQKIFWTAIVTVFAVANASVDRIHKLIFIVLQNLPIKGIENYLIKYNDEVKKAEIGIHYIISIKGLLFFVAFLALACPIVISVRRSRSFWHKLGIKRIAVAAVYFFLALSLLAFPYSYPYGLNADPSGLSGLGLSYGRMSLSPFSESYEIVARRLLKPAIAYFIQMQGNLLYYLFSLICIYILIFMTLVFLEFKISSKHRLGENKPIIYTRKFWVYLSVMTSSYMMVCFQWPGYPENISFILILLAACLPMSRQARLGIVALCMVNHDGSAFALIPIILFCFPKKEIIPALFAVVLFYGIWFLSHGLNLHQGLASHVVVGNHSNWSLLTKNPGLAVAGVFFAYKLLWFLLLYAMQRLWSQGERETALTIASITLFSLIMLLLAWDTTRLSGFGFLGMLIALAVVANDYSQLAIRQRQILLVIVYANLVVPSYNILLEIPDSAFHYPYLGIYKAIEQLVQLVLP